MDRKNLIPNFIALVDALYNNNCNIVCESSVKLNHLFAISMDEAEEFKGDEKFNFTRCHQLLKKMQKDEYHQ